jgi:hypothetical protein
MDSRVGDWELFDEVSWKAPLIAGFHAWLRDVESRFGPPNLRDLESNGVGDFDSHCLRFSCGLELALCRFHLGPQLRKIDPVAEQSWFEVHANQRDLEHIGFHLGVAPATMSRWSARDSGVVDSTPAHRYRVMRQDDNGNEFLVSSVSSRCEADALAREYEARGHKQTYWVDETS